MACGCGPSGCGAHKRDESFDPDFEGPSAADVARFGSDDIECPDCGATVFFDAPLCHRCGHAFMDGEGHRAGSGWGSRRTAIVAIGAAAALAGFIFVTML